VRIARAVLPALALAACTVSSHRLLGPAGAARAPSAVRVLFEPPHEPYRVIASVEASSRGSWAFGVTARQDVVIERLKREAAGVGAEAVLLQELGDHPLQSAVTSMGVESESARGTIDVGIGAGHVFTRAFGRGLAIVREPPSTP